MPLSRRDEFFGNVWGEAFASGLQGAVRELRTGLARSLLRLHKSLLTGDVHQNADAHAQRDQGGPTVTQQR
jgi:hypothetical protein